MVSIETRYFDSNASEVRVDSLNIVTDDWIVKLRLSTMEHCAYFCPRVYLSQGPTRRPLSYYLLFLTNEWFNLYSFILNSA